jgi:helix-turn-helix protein
MKVEPRSWILGESREKLGALIKMRYESGSSIRVIADSIGRSYGFVHCVLGESGATLRGRGGNPREWGTR